MGVGALDGMKVLDLTHYISGPFCSQILADHGAEVIKIEPSDGDVYRKSNPMLKDLSLYFSSMNRNKRSIRLNLKDPEGREVLYRLVKSADALITNYSTGVPERLGFGYETISAINPKIVMTHVTGFGLTGPLKDKGAFDGTIQAMSGIAHLTGEPNGPPMKVGLYIMDHLSAIQAALGTLLALYSCKSTGKGQLVDVSMLDSAVSLLAYNLSDVVVLKNSPKRNGNRSSNTYANVFETKDGYIMIAPLGERMWTALCNIIGREHWAVEYKDVNKRMGDYQKVDDGISEWSRTQRTDDAIRILEKEEIACGPFYKIEDVVESAQLKERNMILSFHVPGYGDLVAPGVPIKLSETPHVPPTRPPHFGEHTMEILREYGFSQSEIDQLVSKNIV